MRAASSVSILLKQVGEGEKFVRKRPKTVECLVAIHLSMESKPRGYVFIWSVLTSETDGSTPSI